MEPTSLINLQLNSSLVEQLQASAYQPWAKETERKTVMDLVSVSNGHIIINPQSDQDLGSGEVCIFEHGAKQAIYGLFSLILNEFSNVAVGYYKVAGTKDVAYERTASLFMYFDDKGWIAFHKMDNKYLPMELPETGDAIETMRLKFHWLNLILKGAYIDINIQDYAPQLYDYFAKMLTMTPEQAKATIGEHSDNAIARRRTWTAAQLEPVTATSYQIDDDVLSTDEVKGIKKIFATNGERHFTAGTSSEAELAYLNYLLHTGYTLSRTA